MTVPGMISYMYEWGLCELVSVCLTLNVLYADRIIRAV